MTNEVMDDATLTKLKKFAFDMHNFDSEEYVDPRIEQEPPEPTFSEEELEAARQEGFNRGKQEGLTEAKASRDQEIAQILQTITTQIEPFAEAENAREKIYELESVKLCHQIFQKLFPRQQKEHGFEELKAVISDILSKNQGHTKIVIQVHPDAKAAVEEHIQSINQDAKFEVTSKDTLDPMSCELKWSEGGAIYHAGTLSDQIVKVVEEALAANGGSLHDRAEKDSAAPGDINPPEDSEPAEDSKPAESAETSEEAEKEIKDDG